VTIAHPAQESLRPRSSVAIALQTAGTLSALIFLISSINEVLSINHLYQSQQFLIGLLLVIFSLWALLEVLRIARQPGSPPLRGLQGILAFQLVLITARHWLASGLRSEPLPVVDPSGAVPAFEQALIVLPVYFLTFLGISHCLISAFSHGEAMRARELRRQMEILRTTKAALEDSENRYRTFFNIPVVGSAITSASRTLLEVNDETCRILGYSREELACRTWAEIFHPDDLAANDAQFQRLLRREIDGYELEMRFIRKDGTIVHTLLAEGCGPIGNQPVDLCYLNLIDISSRKRTEAQLAAAQRRERLRDEQQRRELEQKLKTSLTAAAIAHEIQQPLAAILLNCRLVEQMLACHDPGALPPQLKEKLGALSRDGERVASTMERMRMLLRNVETAHTTVDLAAGLESALLFLRPELKAQMVSLSQEGLERPCHLQGDCAQLQMAAVNLIRNAIQAMEQQHPSSRRLLLRLQRHPDRLNVVVADSGPGFPPDYRSDPSWELLKSTKATGMGLGLFLAQTAASNHHGQLHIGRNACLGGAEVVIELPLVSPGASANPAAP
jgi:PAS domain S-box-containing protein